MTWTRIVLIGVAFVIAVSAIALSLTVPLGDAEPGLIGWLVQ
ncbi:hypothetical protein [Devosia sp. A16]|nr:hypothetical protein [Devosia sp. A16]